jgi:hypothetical protein
MNTYFLTFKVEPATENTQFDMIEAALVHCWVVEDSPEDAFYKASFYVSKYDWIIKNIESYPKETIREDFIERDLGLQNYDKAQEDGIAIVVLAWSRDGKTSSGPKELKPSYSLNINDFLRLIKKYKNLGRCLHYDSDRRCKEIINAHSIQRERSLSAIEYKRHVYKITADFSSLKKSKVKLSCQKVGINKASTFLGFCKKHDNELFEIIDNYPLIPTNQQIFLYGYRSLCRELFVKENSLNIVKSQLNYGPNQRAIKGLLLYFKEGTSFGLENLRRHKYRYDESLKKKNFQNIEYVLFVSDEKPIIAFSGQFYPDYDFMGRFLQDLGDHSSELELITFCSAPMSSGWGFLFSWHVSDSKVCLDFMRSLATMIHEGRKLEDMLFRLVISNCENHAISPQWWDNLPDIQKEQIISRASKMADVLANTPQSYLMEGLEGIATWKFNSVISNMQIT